MALKLNKLAVAFAQQLIHQGRVDTQNSWSSHQPNSEMENSYLEKNSYEDYGKWFLGENTDAKPNTKERYEFPFGDFKKVLKSGLKAVEQRAGQYHHQEISDAAKKLFNTIG